MMQDTRQECSCTNTNEDAHQQTRDGFPFPWFGRQHSFSSYYRGRRVTMEKAPAQQCLTETGGLTPEGRRSTSPFSTGAHEELRILARFCVFWCIFLNRRSWEEP